MNDGLPSVNYLKILPIQRKLPNDVDNAYVKPPSSMRVIDTRTQKW